MGSQEMKGGVYNARDVNDQLFEELILPEKIAKEVQSTWSEFLRQAESREAAGEAIYAALFDAAPSLQSLFRTPRAVMAMRFMNGLNTIISKLDQPKECKVAVIEHEYNTYATAGNKQQFTSMINNDRCCF